MATKLRAFLYARMAVCDAPRIYNPLYQLDACRAYAQAQGYRVVTESTDIGYALPGNRPGIDSLLAHARQGEIEVVVVRELDRLVGSAAAHQLLAELAALHVRVETVAPAGTPTTPQSARLG